MNLHQTFRRVAAAGGVALLIGLSAACHSVSPGKVEATPDQNADEFLFQHGNTSLGRKHWVEAREYFRKLVDTYPTSRFRQDAKLGIGDTYLGENRTESDVLAAGEFREFLRFYPLAAKADYAQYRLALSQVRQVLSPQRDQTSTHEALKELDLFVATYPRSQWLPDVLKLQRQMRDLLSESEFLVGRHYYRSRWYPGAVSRLEALMKDDPKYSKRDGVYFYLAETYYKLNRKADAKALYEKLVEEFRVSDYLSQSKARIVEIEKAPPVPAEAPKTATAPAASPAASPAPASAAAKR